MLGRAGNDHYHNINRTLGLLSAFRRDPPHSKRRRAVLKLISMIFASHQKVNKHAAVDIHRGQTPWPNIRSEYNYDRILPFQWTA